MSASKPSDGRIAAENELLAQLGLPPSASPEDVDQLHLAVSQFLAAAPASVKGWARAQAAALDEAYLTLTDPVGLEGPALRSPTRPPTVVPGGPATPPARRDPVPAVDAAVVAAEPSTTDPASEATIADDTDTDDMDALYASVTPGAHRDLVSGGKPDRAPKPPKAAPQKVAAATVPAATSSGPWKPLAIALLAVVAIVATLAIGYNLGGGGTPAIAAGGASPSPSGPTVDMTKISQLMATLQKSPNDTATMQSIGDTYYAGNDYTDAGAFYDKVLAIDPKNVKALLARGAVYFNSGDLTNAKKDWDLVVSVDPKNQEAHYDLGFFYMNQASPDWSNVQKEWNLVVAIDSTTQLAQTVKQHLDSLATASMIPAPSGSAGATGSPAASGAASPAPSGSATPSGSPAAASPAGNVVNEAAKNLAFVNGTLNAPANTIFTIHFDNQDSGLPHDMLIKDSSGNPVFKGDMVTGPSAVDYTVPALAAGTYTFTCSIHPTTMNGTLVVGG